MQIRKERGNIFKITLTGHELATLISSARWIVEGAKGDLTSDAIGNLKKLLANYDMATKTLFSNTSQDVP